jgi:trigger factor
MKVTQEKLPASQVSLEIEITPEMSKQAYEKVIQKMTRSANIPGFRKGKAPRQVLVQRFGTVQIKAEALEELVESSLKKAIEQEKLQVLGQFQLQTAFEDLVSQFEPGAALTFSAAVDVQPEAKITQYQGFELQAEAVQPDLAQVDRVLLENQERTATLIPVEERPAQANDLATIDFKGVLTSDDPEEEPVTFPGGQADDFQVELSEGKFIPGFVEGIVGMAVGETKEIAIAFPEAYPQETLAGRNVVFTVTLKDLKEKELPELDDDFAQEVSEFETFAELRQSLEDRYSKQAEEKTQANKEQALLDELVKHIEVELPETMIEREVNYLINQMASQLEGQGVDVNRLFNEETIPMMKERSRPDAIDRIKRTLALGEIAKQESIEIEPAAIQKRSAEILAQLQGEKVDLNRLQEVVTEELLHDKIVDWLMERSSFEMVPEGTLTKPEDEEFDTEEELLESAAMSPAIAEYLTSQSIDLEGMDVGVIDVTATEVQEVTTSEPTESQLLEAEITAPSQLSEATDPQLLDDAGAINPDEPIPASQASTTSALESTDA